MTEYEEVKAAVDIALSQVKTAIAAVSEKEPAAEPPSKGWVDSMRAAAKKMDDPRARLLVSLNNTIYELNACHQTNELLRQAEAQRTTEIFGHKE